MEKITKILLVRGYNGKPEILEPLKAELEKRGFRVAMPVFPDHEKLSIEGYFAVFEQFSDFFGPDCAVIAHSIGSAMFLKYLAKTNKGVNRFISLAGFATPFVVEGKETLNDKLSQIGLSEAELKHAHSSIAESFCIFSNNDPLVPYQTLQDFPKLINGEGILVENVGHLGKNEDLTKLFGVVELATEQTEFEFSCGCIVIDGDKILVEKEISRNGDRF